MGIAKAKFAQILGDVFAEGNRIELFATVPDETTESGGVKISGTGYAAYEIKSGDFNVSGNTVTSAKNMMFYLCESEDGHGTAYGFGVYSGNSLLYFGSFREPMPITYNTVPTIKKYNESLKEGVKVTLTSTEVSATAE